MLHIGRNKAGSTTLQDLCLRARTELSERHINYCMFGHLSHSQPGVPGFALFEELAQFACERPEQSHLVSNEFMFGWPIAFTEAAAKALHACDVRILAYIRPYDAWICSAYAEETRRGMNRRDMDAYLAWMRPRISAWPYLEGWGRCFGWNRLRVRSLDPASLQGGDLVTDFLDALGALPIDQPAPRRNRAPHWLELELARRLARRDGDVEWIGAPQAEIVPLTGAMAAVAGDVPPVPYLTLAQRNELLSLYNDDLRRIAAANGESLPEAKAALGEERAAVPALTLAPPPVLAAFFERTTSRAFCDEFPAAGRRAHDLAAECGYGAP